jgi:hypothetical protein
VQNLAQALGRYFPHCRMADAGAARAASARASRIRFMWFSPLVNHQSTLQVARQSRNALITKREGFRRCGECKKTHQQPIARWESNQLPGHEHSGFLAQAAAFKSAVSTSFTTRALIESMP